MLAALCAGSCTEKALDPNDPKGSFVTAKEPYDDKNYEIALTKLGEFKARFPYSQYSIEAELLIADSHFELKQYVEAAAAYEQFVKLHPKHAKVDFALFRAGESYWYDSPEEPDREQEFTEKAIASWRDMVNKRPKGEYTEKAKAYITKGELRIAASAEFVAKYYCKKDIWHACAHRNQQIAERFAAYPDIRRRALTAASHALEELAKGKEKDPTDTSNLYFKAMNAEQLRAKARELGELAKK